MKRTRAGGRLGHEAASGGPGQQVVVDGIEFHVRDEGPRSSAPALVMLHGFMGSTAWFDALLPWLPDRRAVLIDMLGHGGSERPLTGYAPDQQAAAFETILRVLDLPTAVAIGHSMGANMAVALAERSPRVGAVVILDEGPSQDFATNPPGEALMHHHRVGPLVRASSPASAVRSGMKRAFAKGFRAPANFLDQCVTDFRALNHPAWTQSMKERAARRGSAR